MSKPFKLKIIHKGLGLVLVPLVANTIWVVFLANCLAKTEQLVESERNQSITMQHCNNCIIYFAEAIGGMANYITLADRRYQRDGQRNLALLRKEMGILNQGSHGDPSVKVITDEALKAADFQFKALESLEASEGEQSLPQLFAKFKMLTRFLSNVSYKNELLEKYVQQHQAALDKTREDETNARNRAKTIVWMGLAGNFAVAVILLLLFVGNITRRLSILVDNAILLPKQVELRQKVEGNDELTDLDRALHAASAELVRSNEFRRSLMQMMAHDLRSPLSSCALSLDLLERKNRNILADDSLRQIKSMHASIERLINLINDLLIIERFEQSQIPLDLSPENLRELCDSALQSVIGLAEAKNLKVSNLAETTYVVVDRERILQVLVNFLSNAIKFSPTDQSIEISTSEDETSVKVSILDKGPGVSPEDADKLFQKFHQLKAGKKAGGSGLGLAICKLIVDSHHGTVGVKKNDSGGSTFWFRIPKGSSSNHNDDTVSDGGPIEGK